MAIRRLEESDLIRFQSGAGLPDIAQPIDPVVGTADPSFTVVYTDAVAPAPSSHETVLRPVPVAPAQPPSSPTIVPQPFNPEDLLGMAARLAEAEAAFAEAEKAAADAADNLNAARARVLDARTEFSKFAKTRLV